VVTQKRRGRFEKKKRKAAGSHGKKKKGYRIVLKERRGKGGKGLDRLRKRRVMKESLAGQEWAGWGESKNGNTKKQRRGNVSGEGPSLKNFQTEGMLG